MWPVWTQRSPVEGRHWLNAAIESIDDRTPAALAARLVNALAALDFVSGKFEAALAGSLRAASESRKLGDATGEARGQYLAGISLVNLGRVSEGEPLLRRALEAERSLKSFWRVGLALQGIAQARTVVGDLPAARAYVTEALEIYEAWGGGDYNAMRATMLLAKIEFLAGNAARAVQLSTTTLDLTKPRFAFYFFAEILSNLSAYLIACDRWAQAHDRAREALDLAVETQYDSCRARQYNTLRRSPPYRRRHTRNRARRNSLASRGCSATSTPVSMR
jgi:ATP/maltotriose-dependent transcriptional regulator MalT